jgi:hypothetical protein
VRSIWPSFVVAPSAGAKVRTRLRLSTTDEDVLLQVGEYLGSLAGGDLALGCRLGRGPDERTDRKRALTPACSSRWAGTITRTTNDQWTRGYQNLLAERASLRRAIHRMEQRVQAPVGSKAGRAASGAVRYDITLNPDRQRWYLAASWTVQPDPIPSVERAVADGVVAVDLNADHLACRTIDHHGNPVGSPVTIPLELAGLPQATRDGRLRAAVSAVLELAQAHGVQAVVIEDLEFAGARAAGREMLGRGRRGKRRRRIIMGIPTGKFRDRLVQMAHNQGLWVVAADPAYTSRWGGRYWQAPLQQRHPTTIVTRHHAASVVIGRRALGYRARRRAGILDDDQRIIGASNCRPGRPRPGCVNGPGPPGPAPHRPGWQDGTRQPGPASSPGGPGPFGAAHQPRRR